MLEDPGPSPGARGWGGWGCRLPLHGQEEAEEGAELVPSRWCSGESRTGAGSRLSIHPASRGMRPRGCAGQGTPVQGTQTFAGALNGSGGSAGGQHVARAGPCQLPGWQGDRAPRGQERSHDYFFS